MGINNEEKISKLLDFPFDAFLMVRLEYVQILGDELEAKVLRIIEKYIDSERRRIYQQTVNTQHEQVVDITKDVWVPISYRLFKNDLFGTVTSENTIKKALRELIKKKIIFQRYAPQKQYDAPEYTIHISVLQTLLGMLTNPGYQTLIPSFLDTLKNLPPQILTPSECQKLIPSSAIRVSEIDTNIREVTDKSNDNRESAPSSLPRFSLITYADCIAYLKLRNVHPQGDAVEIMVQARTLYVADRAEQYPPSQKKAYVAPVLSQQSEEEHQRVLALFGRPCDTCGRSITTPDCSWCATVRVPVVVPPRQSIPPLTGRVAAVAASSLPTPLSDAVPAPPGRPEEAPAQPQLVALPTKRPRKKAEPLPAMSEEATLVWQRWRSLFPRETPLTRRDMEAAEQLAACTPTAEELGACRKWIFTTDNPARPWYRKIGVGLPDVAKNWARWQSLQDAPPLDLQLVKKAEGPRLPPPMPSDEELRKQVY